MMRTVLESNLRSILRDEERFGFGTVCFCEFAKGGDAGIPDCWVAGKAHWIPLELKRGKSVLKNLRPSQRRWHRISNELGIPTYGLSIDLTADSSYLFKIEIARGDLFETLIDTIKNCDLNYSRVIGNIMAK